jgi:membrane protease YdiL (CAAX protease family)
VTPSKKQLAAESAARTKKGSARKGKVPEAEPAAKPKGGSARKGKVPEAEPAAKVGLMARLLPPRAAPDGAAPTPDGTGEKPEPADGRRYGAGALILVFLAAQLLAALAYGLVVPNTDYDPAAVTGLGGAVGQAVNQFSNGQPVAVSQPVPIWLSTLLQLPLWTVLIVGPIWFAVTRGRGVVADLGLRMKAVDVPMGLAIGVASQLLLVPALYWLVFQGIGTRDVSAEARTLTDRATDPVSVLLLFVIVGIGAPIAEEIYFRGMALPIFGRKIRPMWAVLASAAFFAATHLQPLQFPALLAFGVILGALTVRFGRLGPALWAHIGFNSTAAITLVWGLGLA